MKISIVIPTLNEEKYLPTLLESIKKQSFDDYEAIVADANSTDNTVNIAKSYGAKVVKGGLPGVGRNAGAKVAKGDFIFFIDSDVYLPKNFLKKAYDEMQRRYLDIATCELRPISNLLIDKIMHKIINLGMRIYQFTDPEAFGICIIVARRLFNRIGGFDESIRWCEDSEFVKRASNYAPFRVLKSPSLYVSVRRMEKEGRLVMICKFLYSKIYRKFKGEIRTDSRAIKYEFAHYDKKKERKLKKLAARLKLINQEYKGFIREHLHANRLTGKYAEKLRKLKEKFSKLNKSFKSLMKNG